MEKKRILSLLSLSSGFRGFLLLSLQKYSPHHRHFHQWPLTFHSHQGTDRLFFFYLTWNFKPFPPFPQLFFIRLDYLPFSLWLLGFFLLDWLPVLISLSLSCSSLQVVFVLCLIVYSFFSLSNFTGVFDGFVSWILFVDLNLFDFALKFDFGVFLEDDRLWCSVFFFWRYVFVFRLEMRSDCWFCDYFVLKRLILIWCLMLRFFCVLILSLISV